MNRLHLRRFFVSLLLLAFALSITAGCGAKVEPTPVSEPTAAPTQTVSPTATAEPTPMETPAPEPTAAPEPVETPEPTEDPSAEQDQPGTREDKPVSEPVKNADGSVTVFSIEQMLNALKPGQTVILGEGTYNVTRFYENAVEADNGLWFDHWCFNWGTLCIFDLQDITLRAQEGVKVELVTEDPYAGVLSFVNCENMEISGLTMGHHVEPGHCTGDVIELDYCRNVRLSDMDLYGCGTYGLSADHCIGVNLYRCLIRECSYGIVHTFVCDDLTFDSCTMRDCGGFEQLDMFYTSASFSDCTFPGNQSQYGFLPGSDTNSISFFDCQFDSWAKDELKKGAAKLSGIWGAEPFDFGAHEYAPQSIGEFIECIQPHADIRLDYLDGTLDLSAYLEQVWAEEGEAWNDRHIYVQIVDCFDGLELYIRNVEDLSISSYINVNTGSPATEITVDPRYASVFNFVDCSGLRLRGLTLGHTELGECFGNVLLFDSCQNVMLEDLDIYGCGYYGISMEDDCSDFCMNQCILRDCSAGPCCIEYCRDNIIFNGCTLTGSNSGGYYYNENATPYFLFCTFGDYESSTLLYRNDVTTDNCVWSDSFVGEYPDYWDWEWDEDLYDPANAVSVPFDTEDLTYIYWNGWRYTNTETGESYRLPYYDENDQPVRYGLSLSDDGSGVYTVPNGEEQKDIPFTWVCAANYSADIFFDDSGISQGSVGLFYEEHDEEESNYSRYWLLLTLNDGTQIWFY